MAPGRDVKYSMEMYFQNDCDSRQIRKVQYGNVFVEGL